MPKREASGAAETAGTLSSAFRPPKLGVNKSVLLKTPPRLWCFVVAVRADSYKGAFGRTSGCSSFVGLILDVGCTGICFTTNCYVVYLSFLYFSVHALDFTVKQKTKKRMAGPGQGKKKILFPLNYLTSPVRKTWRGLFPLCRDIIHIPHDSPTQSA